MFLYYPKSPARVRVPLCRVLHKPGGTRFPPPRTDTLLKQMPLQVKVKTIGGSETGRKRTVPRSGVPKIATAPLDGSKSTEKRLLKIFLKSDSSRHLCNLVVGFLWVSVTARLGLEEEFEGQEAG